MKLLIERLVSGGQSGADRASLDWAIANGIPHGGWCPRGRKAEDGPIDNRYQLQETRSADYLQRTEWNVRDTDATVIFTITDKLTGGSRRTAEFASVHGKPVLHLAAERHCLDPGGMLREFVVKNRVRVLNVAGSRASKEPKVGEFVVNTLTRAFGHSGGERVG